MKTKILFMLFAATLFLKGDSHSASHADEEPDSIFWCGCFSGLLAWGWGSAPVAPAPATEPEGASATRIEDIPGTHPLRDVESGLPLSNDELRGPEGAGASIAALPAPPEVRRVIWGLKEIRDHLEKFSTEGKALQLLEVEIKDIKNELFEHLLVKKDDLENAYNLLSERLLAVYKSKDSYFPCGWGSGDDIVRLGTLINFGIMGLAITGSTVAWGVPGLIGGLSVAASPFVLHVLWRGAVWVKNNGLNCLSCRIQPNFGFCYQNSNRIKKLKRNAQMSAILTISVNAKRPELFIDSAKLVSIFKKSIVTELQTFKGDMEVFWEHLYKSQSILEITI